MEATHTRIRVFCIGYSIFGQPIHALSIGGGRRGVMVNASHHANEWITTLLLTRFVQEHANEISGDITLSLIPMVNPDGVYMLTNGWVKNDWKANARGVDLNANYPAGWEKAREIKKALGYGQPGPKGYVGKYPLSEPESRAMAAFTQYMGFDLSISLHTQGEEIYWRYGDFIPPGARDTAKRLAQAGGYLLEDAPDESSHAGYKDWFIQTFNKPGFTLECGLGENPLPIGDFDDIYEKVKKMLSVVCLQ
jgi:g-D-glutamyl-meso-diaminopimelate peptidase